MQVNGMRVYVMLDWCFLLQSDFEQNYRTKRERVAVEKSVLLKYADYHLQRCQSQRFQSKKSAWSIVGSS